MHNVWLIAKREYLERIRTKSFLIATIVIPLIMAMLVFGSHFLASHAKSESHIAVVTTDSTFAADLKRSLESSKNSQMKVDIFAPSDAVRRQLDEQIKQKDGTLAGYLWVTPSPNPGDRPIYAYKARSAGDIATESTLQDAIQTVTTRERLMAHGLAPADIDALTTSIKLDTSASGSTEAAFFTAYLLFFLMYMVIMLYGMNTARSIIEEKTSRVFEVLLATIKPDELLAGKIIGVGSVGLTQIGVWMLVTFIIANSGISSMLGGAGHAPVSIQQIVFFVVYFVFGFLIYSSIAAALGAMTNSEQELQQLNMLLVIPLVFCFAMLAVVIPAPDSTTARVVSLIPFCSPLLMNFRISLTQVAPWEIWLSFGLMSLTIASILWFSSRIYRIGILMYGKKPSLPEILRWLKYS